MYKFRWNAWNIEHIAKHGISETDAEFLVNCARKPYPAYRGDDKWLVIGKTEDGWFAQVIFIFDPEDVVYVIHARSLTDAEKRRYRRRRR